MGMILLFVGLLYLLLILIITYPLDAIFKKIFNIKYKYSFQLLFLILTITICYMNEITHKIIKTQYEISWYLHPPKIYKEYDGVFESIDLSALYDKNIIIDLQKNTDYEKIYNNNKSFDLYSIQEKEEEIIKYQKSDLKNFKDQQSFLFDKISNFFEIKDKLNEYRINKYRIYLKDEKVKIIKIKKDESKSRYIVKNIKDKQNSFYSIERLIVFDNKENKIIFENKKIVFNRESFFSIIKQSNPMRNYGGIIVDDLSDKNDILKFLGLKK